MHGNDRGLGYLVVLDHEVDQYELGAELLRHSRSHSVAYDMRRILDAPPDPERRCRMDRYWDLEQQWEEGGMVGPKPVKPLDRYWDLEQQWEEGGMVGPKPVKPPRPPSPPAPSPTVVVVPHSDADARLVTTRYYRDREDSWFACWDSYTARVPAEQAGDMHLTEAERARLDVVLDVLRGDVREHGWFDVQFIY
jgi:hypothetical protein